jgi:hypothetical protein
VEHAAAAVLHYFQNDLEKTSVTIGEFTAALEIALRGMGIQVTCDSSCATAPSALASTPLHADLRRIAFDSGKEFELGFFTRLRDLMRDHLRRSPGMLKFSGLRSCVKQLAGARRWSPRCQALSDQIVDYLRGCLAHDAAGNRRDLLVL